jgi:hypothetical protein
MLLVLPFFSPLPDILLDIQRLRAVLVQPVENPHPGVTRTDLVDTVLEHPKR